MPDAAAPQQPVSLTVEQAFHQAIAHHQAGELQDAERLYLAVIQAHPNHPDANHNLGVLAGQVGQYAAGLPYLKTALTLNPAQGQYALSYAEALLETGQIKDALDIVGAAMERGFDTPAAQVLRKKIEAAATGDQSADSLDRIDKSAQSHAQADRALPSESLKTALTHTGEKKSRPAKRKSIRKASPFHKSWPQAELNRLVAMFHAGRHVELESQTRMMVEQCPDFGFAWKLLWASLQAQGRDGLPAKQKAAQLLPDDADAHFNLANAQRDLGQLDAAVASYRRALKNMPRFAVVHSNLGATLRELGRLDDAVASCRRAIEIDPRLAEAHSNLGNALKNLGQLDNAEVSYRKALEFKPDYVEAHSNLGDVRNALGHIDDAVSSFRRALALKPVLAEAQNNLGNALKDLGQLNAAAACYRRALAIKPDYTEAHSNLIFMLDLAAWVDLATLQQERRLWDSIHAAPLAVFQRAHANRPDPARRLRIGYVSADFRAHSAAAAFGAMLLQFDPAAFDVVAYSNNATEDALTHLFQQRVTLWRKVVGRNDEAVAELIRQDEIDILVDLSGHSAGNRLLVFARKPAPIQITAWGYASSTGMRAMDVFFADPIVVPPDEKHFYAEEVRYLPSAIMHCSSREFPAVNSLPALSANRITFGSFNRLTKISNDAYQVWAQILLAVPGSRMVLKTGELNDAGIQAHVLQYFTRAGVDPARITLLGKTSWIDHVAAFGLVDIGLDPFPQGGGVTAMEGLMMGVPVVTRRWPTIPGRASASILTAVGLTDWIAESSEEYVAIAVRKAQDLPALALLREQLRNIFTSSINGDPQAYVNAVEKEYRQLWREWCARRFIPIDA